MTKIYEFQYIDKLNLSEVELIDRIESILADEADFYGWEQGYTFRQCLLDGLQANKGERTFVLEVFGKFIDSKVQNLSEEEIENKHEDFFSNVAKDNAL